MPIDWALVLLCLIAGLVFAAIRLVLAGRVSAFWIDVLSLGFALLVFASRTILGYKI